MTRSIVPPYLLAHLAEADATRLPAPPRPPATLLAQLDEVRSARSAAPPGAAGRRRRRPEVERTISDAQGTEQLPGVTGPPRGRARRATTSR